MPVPERSSRKSSQPEQDDFSPGVEQSYRRQLESAWGPAKVPSDLEELTAKIKSSNARVVIYVASRLFYTIVRQASELRRRGIKTYLFCMTPLTGDLEDMAGDTFAGHVAMRGGYGCLAHLLRACEPDVVHVQCTMLEYHLGRFVLERAEGAKVFCEFYDLTSVYAPRAQLHRNWDRDAIDADLEHERFICRTATGVIHRFQSEVDDELRGRHGKLVPSLRLWPLYQPGFALSRPHGRTRCRDRPRLVYAGGLVPPDDYHLEELYPMRGMIDVIPRLLDSGFDVDVLHDPGRPLARSWGLEAYRELHDRQIGFRLLDGVSPLALAQRLSDYDFGIILTDLRRSGVYCGPSLFAGSGTKLFTYLEAEIPVITNSEFTTNARLVEEHGIGCVVGSADIESLRESVRGRDYADMVRSVQRFNQSHNMVGEIDRLLAFYEGASARRRYQ